MGLSTQKLTLAYDDRPVVQDLDLEIMQGRLTAIVGANACGKSTLLRGLARLLKPRAGAITAGRPSPSRRSPRASWPAAWASCRRRRSPPRA